MQRSKSLHEIYESFAQTCVKLPFAHSSPAKFQMATRKPLKYVKTWKTQLEHGTFEIIEGWPASSQRRHLRFKLCSSQFLDGDPGPIFEAGGTECFRTLAEKSGNFSLQKSLTKNLQRSHIIHIIPNLFCGSWSLLESRKLLDCELQACLKGVWRRAPAFSLEGWPIKCQWPVSCLWIYRCEPGSNAELRHVQGASLFPDVFSKLDTSTHLDSKNLDLRLLW